MGGRQHGLKLETLVMIYHLRRAKETYFDISKLWPANVTGHLVVKHTPHHIIHKKYLG